MQAEVEFGDIWQVGPHLLASGDLELGHGLDLLNQAEAFGMRPPSLFYCDPPWNLGIAKSFRTRGGLGGAAHVDFENLMRALLLTAAQVQGDIFIEMGAKHAPKVMEWAHNAGLAPQSDISVTYNSEKGNSRLLQISQRNTKPRSRVDFARKASNDLPGLTMEQSTEPGGVVFDTCLGLGCTLRHAHRLGRVCLGMELDPARLARSMEWVRKKTRSEPRRLGSLL